jgi:hypothetical protein
MKCSVTLRGSFRVSRRFERDYQRHDNPAAIPIEANNAEEAIEASFDAVVNRAELMVWTRRRRNLAAARVLTIKAHRSTVAKRGQAKLWQAVRNKDPNAAFLSGNGFRKMSMDTRAFSRGNVPPARRRRAAPAVVIVVLVAGVLIGLYTSGVLRIGATSDGHGVDVDVSAPRTVEPTPAAGNGG